MPKILKRWERSDRVSAGREFPPETALESTRTEENRGKGKFPIPMPQMRVLAVLAKARGPLSRLKLSDKIGNKTQVVVGRAIGYSDPAKRTAFEQTKDGGGAIGMPCPSLLTRGYVTEVSIEVEEGITELCVVITDAGRSFLDSLGDFQLPPLRD